MIGFPQQPAGNHRRASTCRRSGPNYRAIFGNPLAKYCFGAVFIESVVVFGVFPHMAALLHQAGESRASIAGIVLAGFGIGAVIYTFCVGWLLCLLGERKMMIGGGLIMARLLPDPDLASALAAGIRQFRHARLWLLLAAWLHPESTPPSWRQPHAARLMALHSASFFLGQAVGPVVYGSGLRAGWERLRF